MNGILFQMKSRILPFFQHFLKKDKKWNREECPG